jgi:serine/threonine-protein kinase
MTLNPGTRLGPYEILSLLGAGGMGEVYRARDTRLGRDVAIKSLPAEFARDAERVARFEREARLLAALSHPNIAGIYGLEEVDGARYLALEFVEGESLAARLARGSLSSEDALPICAQIATAVEAAHEAGIVHRDLKPGNVMLKPDGTVKVLDFGLARSGASDSTSDPNLTASPTLTYAGTTAGVILGTAAYMSPEQARGKHVDRRTDIWSFGCVLWECLTGQQLFSGETVSDIIARILQTEPDWNGLPDGVPPRVPALLKRCLTRDPKQRLRDIGEARIVLESDHEATAPTVASDSQAPRSGWFSGRAIVLTLGVALIAAVAAWMFKPAETTERPLRVLDLVANDIDVAWYMGPVLSPDGSRLAYQSGNHIWVRDFGRAEPRSVADFEDDTPIAWSPDGTSLVYEDRGKVWRVAIDEARPVAVADIPETGSLTGIAWGAENGILITVWRGGLYSVSPASGAVSKRLVADPATQVDFHFPVELPNGDVMLTVHHQAARDSTGAQKPALRVIRGDEVRMVANDDIADASFTSYRDGRLFYCRDNAADMWMVDYDLANASIESDAVRVLPDVIAFSLGGDGSLLYMNSSVASEEYELVQLDTVGNWKQTIVAARSNIHSPELSPDGTRVAYSAGTYEARDIYVYDLRRATDTRLTFEGGFNGYPHWLDNQRIIYSARPEGLSIRSHVVMRNADGSGTPRVISSRSSSGTGLPTVVPTPDPDRYLQIVDAELRGDLRVMEIAPDGEAKDGGSVLKSDASANADDMAVSPDGKLLAYVADARGVPNVFLTRYPSGDGKWQVSTGGGRMPHWARDSRSLYYVEGVKARRLARVEMDPAAPVPMGATATVFPESGSGVRLGRGYDVGTATGFIAVRPAGGGEAPAARMILMENWLQNLNVEQTSQ